MVIWPIWRAIFARPPTPGGLLFLRKTGERRKGPHVVLRIKFFSSGINQLSMADDVYMHGTNAANVVQYTDKNSRCI